MLVDWLLSSVAGPTLEPRLGVLAQRMPLEVSQSKHLHLASER